MALTRVGGHLLQNPLNNVGVISATSLIKTGIDTSVSGIEVGTPGSPSAKITNTGNASFSGVVTATSFDGNVVGRINPTTLNVTGVATFQSNIFLGDGDIAYFGDGQDLLIFHNSTDSIIRDNGTGDLFIEGGNRIKLTNPTGIETYAVFNQDGASELWYDNAKKFETTTFGVTVFGDITASNATITGNVSVAGTVTYEDVTNVDSIGVVTARSGLQVGTGGTVITATAGGLVGIGTANPTAKLHVNNGSAIISNPSPGSRESVLLVTDEGTSTTATGGATLRVSNDGSASNFAVFEASSTSSNFVITNAGNVGVGITNPGEKLEVFGATTSTIQISGGGSGSDPARKATLALLASGNKLYNLRADASDGSFRILDSNTERFRIGQSGSVGIGTNESYGDSNASFTSLSLGGNGTRYGLLEINRSDGTAGSWIDCYGTGGNGDLRITTAGTSGAITFWTGGGFTEKVRITGIGSVGIGITSPQSILDVQGGQFRIRSSGTYSDPTDNAGIIAYDSISGDLNISARSSGGSTALAFRTSNGGTGSEKLRITSAGDLQQPNSGSIYYKQTSASVNMSTSDWVNVGYIPYGGDVSGEVMVSWSGYNSPACCHHGFMRFNVGCSYGPTYISEYAYTLNLLEEHHHNDFYWSAIRIITGTISGTAVVYIQCRARQAATGGTIRTTVRFGEHSLQSSGAIETLTPVVDNTQSGTVARHLFLRNDPNNRKVTTTNANIVQSALGGNTNVEGNLTTFSNLTNYGYHFIPYGNGKSYSNGGYTHGSSTRFIGQICPGGVGNSYLHVKISLQGGAMFWIHSWGYSYNYASNFLHEGWACGYEYNNQIINTQTYNTYANHTMAIYRAGDGNLVVRIFGAMGTSNAWGYYAFEGGVDGIVGQYLPPMEILAWTWSSSSAAQY